jgi:hypothetical protein
MSKAYDNAKELNFINFDSANNRLNFGLPITSNGANISTDITVYGANSTSNTYFALPTGNLVSRPASPPLGAMRYNTTNSWPEIYTTNGWQAFAAQPYITSVSPSVIAGNSNAVIDIYGTNFGIEAQVYFIDNFNNAYLANTVTYYSNTHISAPTPRDFTIGVEPLDVKVVQNSGIYTLENAIDCGTVPTWVTTAGSLGSIFGANTVNVYVSATDAEGSVVTYSLVSGSLPGGLNLTSNGLVQGVATGVTATTTYNFTIKASDVVTNNVDRAFSYQILNRVPVFNTASSLSNITDSMLDNYSANVSVNAYDPDGGVVTYAVTVGSVPTGFTLNTSNGALQLTDANTAERTTNTTSTFTVSATDVGSGVETRQFTVTVEPPIDSDFSNTVLLLSATDSNNIIKDASSNNLNLVVTGDSRATNFSPYNTSWSNSFDGNGDNLATSSYVPITWLQNASPTGTIEAFVYLTGYRSPSNAYQQPAILGLGATYLNLGFSSSGNLRYYWWNGSSGAYITSSGTVPLNTWTHVAITFSAGNVKLWINGNDVGSGTVTALNNGSGMVGNLCIGSEEGLNNSTGSSFIGYISNLRIANNTVYSANFTPSTTSLTTTANTTLLSCHTNRFVNEANTSMPIIRNNDVKVVGWSPFAETDTSNGSMYFDGTSDYVQMMTPYNFGSNNFTVEGWFYLTNISDTALWGASNGGGQVSKFQAYISGGTLGIDFNGSSIISVTAATYLKSYSWNHIAVCRGGTSTNQTVLFINGVRAGTGTMASQTGVTTNWGIGYMELGAIKESYISNFRIVDGTDVYGFANTTYTVSTTPLANIANTKLLTLQNRQPHNNHGFQDKSNNKSLITRNGNTTQGTFSPFSAEQGKWSSYFNGSSTFGIASNSALNILAYDTIECWVYMSVLGTSDLIVGRDSSYWLGYNHASIGGASNKFVFAIYNTGSSWQSVSSTTTPVVGKWYHILGVKDNTTLRIYINGVQENTSTFSGTPNNGGGFWVGSNQNGENLEGYVSNARLITGASNAIFPYAGLTTGSSFTVPSSPLTAVSGTQVLTSQNNRFVDNSPNAFTVTPTSGPYVVPFSPFSSNSSYSKANVGGSIYFDGTTDYLTLADSDLWDLPGDFTIDGWMYILQPQAGGFVSVGRYDNPQNGIDIYVSQTSGFLIFYSNGAAVITGEYIYPRTWYHIALVRSGTTVTLYVNGKRTGGTATSSVSYTGVSGFGVGIGVEFGGGANIGAVTAAYIANPRIIKGQALYTANTSVPTEPPRVTSNTVLLIDGTDAAIIDYTGKNVIETVADAKSNTSIFKFSNSSIWLDGTTDSLYLPSSPLFALGTGDFTLEAWVYLTAHSDRTILGYGSSNSGGVAIFADQSGQRRIYIGATAVIQTAGSFPLNSWFHVAAVRSGSNLYLFQNGSQIGTTTDTTNITGTTFRVGESLYSNMIGGLSDIRVSRIARYTANFTPRPRKLPRR